MRVYELIEMLQNCPQDAIVMYDLEPAIKNKDLVLVEDANEEETLKHLGVDDVLVGYGALTGFVYLADEVLTD